jgi:hypothetical protein
LTGGLTGVAYPFAMDVRRLRIDLFAFALGALALLTYSFYSSRNGAAVIMCALCFGALLTARLIGFTNRALVPVAIGLVILLWVVWVHPPELSTRKISAIAHGAGGLLIGWALSEYLRHRVAWPLWAIGAVAAVFGLAILWELAEYLGDRAFDTELAASKSDSALDIAFGTIGGCTATVLAAMIPTRRERWRSPPRDAGDR